MTCPVCGYTFTEYKNVCDACVLHKTCSLVCCPNCHYQFPQESKVVNFITKLFSKDKSNAKS